MLHPRSGAPSKFDLRACVRARAHKQPLATTPFVCENLRTQQPWLVVVVCDIFYFIPAKMILHMERQRGKGCCDRCQRERERTPLEIYGKSLRRQCLDEKLIVLSYGTYVRYGDAELRRVRYRPGGGQSDRTHPPFSLSLSLASTVVCS